MIIVRKYQLVQRVLLLGILLEALYFFLVFLPLNDRVIALDKPLQEAWVKLIKVPLTHADTDGVDLGAIEESLRRMDHSSNRMASLDQTLLHRISLDAATRQMMRQQFQLVDFQNERQLRLEELARVAKEKKIIVGPAVNAGYPEYSTDQKQPALLWGCLSIIHDVLLTALNSQVTSIDSVAVRPFKPFPAETTNTAPILDELSFTLQLSGPMPAISRFLATLPLKKEEAHVLGGLPEVPESKPSLFVDRILLRKETPENPDTVRAELRITSLAYRDSERRR